MLHPPHRKLPPPPDSLPPLPIDADLWQVVAKTLRLTGQLKLVVELVLRGQSDEQMMEVMGIGYSTLRTYFDRIAVRTGARGRTALLRLILTVSHGVKP